MVRVQLAEVLGQVVATVKQGGLDRFTLLVLQDVAAPQGPVPAGSYVAVDLVGAGVGELVLVTSGSAARVAAGADAPVDRAVVAIVDTVTERGALVHGKT